MLTTMRLGACLLTIALAATVWALPAAALDEKKDEKEKLKLCERRMCEMVVKKAPATGHVNCQLSKTWARKSIKDTSEAKKISWGFGDARCFVDLKVPRSIIVDALKQPEIKVELPLHTVDCEIEREKEVTKVRFTLGPKVLFKDGRAKKVWVNLKDVEGPGVIKGLAMTVARLEDSIGLFQKDLTKGINTFIAEKCPTVAAGR
jgi:hypothetical protein